MGTIAQKSTTAQFQYTGCGQDGGGVCGAICSRMSTGEVPELPEAPPCSSLRPPQ